MPAPRIIAKGKGMIAERLINIAKKNGVPVLEDRLLVDMLDKLNINQDIPSNLYQIVAEILVAIYKTDTGEKVK